MPDAVCYEALFDVFSVHRRPDLIPVYMHRLSASEVRPTAYVANAVIKGYSVVGDIDSARAMFESLQDPPTGIAAPFNHCTTKGGVRQYQKPSDEPSANVIYREPSTWEAMVRAELAAGNNDEAQNLVKRMETRLYPDLVVQRVRDIVDPPVVMPPFPNINWGSDLVTPSPTPTSSPS